MFIIKTDCSKMAELRIRKGMTGIDLAERIGVAKQTIYRIENGTTNPSPASAISIADKLGVPFDDIFSIVEGV